MGLLDDPIMPKVLPTHGRYRKGGYRADENFEELQNLGHEENSPDFGDSMFADRVEVEQCLYCGAVIKSNGVLVGAIQEHSNGQCV